MSRICSTGGWANNDASLRLGSVRFGLIHGRVALAVARQGHSARSAQHQPRHGRSLAEHTTERESLCALRSGVTPMARRSGFTLIELSCGGIANAKGIV
jgi:hypothetical protein